MNQKEKLLLALCDFAIGKEFVSIEDIVKAFGVERTTAYRYMKQLVAQERFVIKGKGKYALIGSHASIHYLNKPFFEREKKSYNPAFLESYIPNQSYFLNDTQRTKLHTAIHDIALDTNFYHTNKRLLETMVIDISFASSHLEGNTYSYLDTEILVKYNEIASDKAQEETQMILNHKKTLEYLIYHKDTHERSQSLFFAVHRLLGQGLLPAEHLGIIRKSPVEIGLSAYTPIALEHQLYDEFMIFLSKLRDIRDPFEQSLFVMVFVPYFQLFLDINKRTSRMLANLPLLKHHLPLISLLQVKVRDYITAILAVYECHDVSLLATLYVDNYLLNMGRYRG